MNRVKAGATLATGLGMTHLDLAELWLRYFAVGGGCSFQALRDYLAGDVDWNAHEHDIAALALNEYFLEQGVDQTISYAEEL